MNLHRSLGWVGCLAWMGVQAGAGAVSLALRIPDAETWVLGDAIPLYWRFENEASQPLGFMWEGCCRLNGKLEVWDAVGGQRLETAPPGQALAHMFAKADRLEPGVAKEYDTRVGDWVALPGTGRYRLRGTYRGVLPSQFPQVQRGLALWRDAATSAGVEVSVVSVADYLAQRAERSGRRGVRVTLSGPGQISPSVSSVWRVGVENLGGGGWSFRWPDDFSLWVVDGAGQRGAPAAVISGALTNLTVGGGGRWEGRFEIPPDRFEGVELGEYQVFVDLAAGSRGEPRVPSAPLRVAWRLGSEEVLALVQEAARGAGTGARNAALKMLRVHLGDVGRELARLDRSPLDADARRLADRLGLAARLRPLSPKPGTVGIPVAVDASGVLSWAHPVLRDALGGVSGGIEGQVRELVGVRRHLGWELRLEWVPAGDATLGAILDAGERLVPDPSEWSGSPEVLVGGDVTRPPSRVRLRAAAGGGVSRDALGGRAFVEPEAAGGPCLAQAGITWNRLHAAMAAGLQPAAVQEVLVVR